MRRKFSVKASFYIPELTYKKFKRLCQSEMKTFSEKIRSLLYDFMKSAKNKSRS